MDRVWHEPLRPARSWRSVRADKSVAFMSVSAQDPSWDSNRKKGYITRQLTAIIEREGDGFVVLCLEVDVASQGNSVDESRSPNNRNDDSP